MNYTIQIRVNTSKENAIRITDTVNEFVETHLPQGDTVLCDDVGNEIE